MSTDDAAQNNENGEQESINEDLKELGRKVGEKVSEAPDASRRAFIAGLASAGVLGAMAQPVAAQAGNGDSYCEWAGNIDANGYNLRNLGGLETTGDGTIVDTLAGSGLSIRDGALTTGGGGTAGLWEDPNDDGILTTAQSDDTGIDVGSVTTDRVVTDSRLPSVVVFTEDSTFYADGRESLVDSGPEAAAVIQSAQDNLPDVTTKAADPPSGGKVALASGLYTVDTTITVNRKGVEFEGAGFSDDFGPTVLKLGDSQNTDLFNLDYHTSDTTVFTSWQRMDLYGNKANNTSGRGIFIGANEKDHSIDHVFVSSFAGKGVEIAKAWGHLMTNTLVEGCGGYGVDFTGGSNAKVLNCKINSNGGRGLSTTANDMKIANCEFASNTDEGLGLNGQDSRVVNCRIESNGDPEIVINDARVTLTACQIRGDGSDTGVQLFSNAEDTRFHGCYIENVGTKIAGVSNDPRPRWNGVIGGGPLGGKDLSSITSGVEAGILGVHDGTGVIPSDTLCIWDGSNWRLINPVSFQYTGDGTTGRTLASNFQFEYALVTEAGADNAEDAYAGNVPDGTLTGNTFSGELTVGAGITVGDNSGDADPNTDTETYDVYAA